VNQNLLYIVARANVDRIYGDLRFDWIDDDWTEAVVSVGARLPGLDHDHAVPTSKEKMIEMAARTREGRTR